MDIWKPLHVKYMELGGNERALEALGPADESDMSARYKTPEADEYRSRLKKSVYTELGLPLNEETVKKTPTGDDLQRRFGNATSISSSQLHPHRPRPSENSLCPCCNIL